MVESNQRSSSKPRRSRNRESSFFDVDSSVLKGLFDLNFRRFITPSIIKSLYAAYMLFVIALLFALVWMNYRLLAGTATRNSYSPALVYLSVAISNLLAIIILFVCTLIVRLCLEAVMVLFRGEEHLRDLAEMAHQKMPVID
jgi:hypothetical protein